MKGQILSFLRYFKTIEDGTNKDIQNSKIETIYFNPEFHKAFIKQQYIKEDDTTFRGYPFVIESEDDADYWGMMCKGDTKDKSK